MRRSSVFLALIAVSSISLSIPASAITTVELFLISLIQENGWSTEECPGQLLAYFYGDPEYRDALKELEPGDRRPNMESLRNLCEIATGS